MHVEYSRKFLKSLSRLSARVIDQAQEKEAIFKLNPFDSRLKTHKLHGREKDVWAFSVDYSYRIKFIFITIDKVLFLEIGTHNIYE